MDNIAFDKQFEFTLDLIPNTYIFLFPQYDDYIFQTRCQYLKEYIISNCSFFTQSGPNFFFTLETDQKPKVDVLVQQYYEMTGGKCIPPEG